MVLSEGCWRVRRGGEIVPLGVGGGGSSLPRRMTHLSDDEAVAKIGHPDVGHPPKG